MHRRYHCNQCRKCLSSQQTLDNHRTTKGCLKKAKLIQGIIIPDYSCPTCDIKIPDPINLEALSKLKLANIEPNKNARECNQCGYEAKFKSQMTEHLRTCKGSTYDSKRACKICLYPFYDSKVFKQHKCSEEIQCQLCHEFGTIAHVQLHLVSRLTIGEIKKGEKKTISLNCCYDVVNKMVDSLPEKYLIAQGILPFWIHQDKDTSFRIHFILEFYWNSYHKPNPESPLLIDVPKHREQLRLHCTGIPENKNKDENGITTEFERGKMPYSCRSFVNDPQKKRMTLQWNQLYILQNLTLNQLTDAHLDEDLQKRNSYAETVMKRKYEARMTPWRAQDSKREDYMIDEIEGIKREIWNMFQQGMNVSHQIYDKMMQPWNYPFSECLFPLQPNFILNAMAPMNMYSETEIAIKSASKVERDFPETFNFDLRKLIATEPEFILRERQPPEALEFDLRKRIHTKPQPHTIKMMLSNPVYFFNFVVFEYLWSPHEMIRLALVVFHKHTPHELNYLKVMTFLKALPEKVGEYTHFTRDFNYNNFYTHLYVLARWITSYLFQKSQLETKYDKELESMTGNWRSMVKHVLKTEYGIEQNKIFSYSEMFKNNPNCGPKFPSPENIMKPAEKPIITEEEELGKATGDEEEDEQNEFEVKEEKEVPDEKEAKEVPRSVYRPFTEVKEQNQLPIYEIDPMIMYKQPCPEKIIEKEKEKETHFRDPRLVLQSVSRKQKRKRSKEQKVQRMRVKLQKT